jgi:hypothetical protein
VTVARQKVDSRLLEEMRRQLGGADTSGPTGVTLDGSGRASVDIRAEVTPELEGIINRLGGSIVSTSPRYRSIVAWLPLSQLEALARFSLVHAILPPAELIVRRP